jgi:hypothetical protein
MATHGIRYGEGLQVVLLEPITTIADGESEWIELENYQWLTLFVYVGSITASTDSVNVYVRSTTSATSGTTNSNDYALPFDYRLSSALGTDSWGSITSVTTATGYVAISGTDDNKMVQIELNPDIIYAHDSDAKYIYLDFDATVTSTDTIYLGAWGVFEPRYPQNSQLSSSA